MLLDRINSQGLPRSELLWALGQTRIISKARKEQACLLCRRYGVNEAALCETCYSLLGEEELKAAERWLSGAGPR